MDPLTPRQSGSEHGVSQAHRRVSLDSKERRVSWTGSRRVRGPGSTAAGGPPKAAPQASSSPVCGRSARVIPTPRAISEHTGEWRHGHPKRVRPASSCGRGPGARSVPVTEGARGRPTRTALNQPSFLGMSCRAARTGCAATNTPRPRARCRRASKHLGGSLGGAWRYCGLGVSTHKPGLLPSHPQ